MKISDFLGSVHSFYSAWFLSFCRNKVLYASHCHMVEICEK